MLSHAVGFVKKLSGGNGVFLVRSKYVHVCACARALESKVSIPRRT